MQPARDSVPGLVQGLLAAPLPTPPTLAPPGLPPWGREWAWPLSWSCCSCSRSPVPSTQRRFLSKHEVLIACCPESKSSYEGSGSPQGVCVCVRAHARWVRVIWFVTMVRPSPTHPGFGLAFLNLHPLCACACAYVFVWLRMHEHVCSRLCSLGICTGAYFCIHSTRLCIRLGTTWPLSALGGRQVRTAWLGLYIFSQSSLDPSRTLYKKTCGE